MLGPVGGTGMFTRIGGFCNVGRDFSGEMDVSDAPGWRIADGAGNTGEGIGREASHKPCVVGCVERRLDIVPAGGREVESAVKRSVAEDDDDLLAGRLAGVDAMTDEGAADALALVFGQDRHRAEGEGGRLAIWGFNGDGAE